MSRFKSTISALEAQLRHQQKLVRELEEEREGLQQRQQALLATLSTLQSGASAITAANAIAAIEAAAEAAASASAAGTGAARGSAHVVAGPGMLPVEAASGRQGQPRQLLSVARVQQQLEALQQLLERPGEAAESALVGTLPPSPVVHVLRSLTADPGRVLSYLALSVEERLQFLGCSVRQLGLLLPKYNHHARYRSELETLTQELLARGVTYTWLDPEFSSIVQMQLINMESGEVEPHYPPGFLAHVAQTLELQPHQKMSLQALYSRLKAVQTPLLTQHDLLLQQVDRLQRHQHREQQVFAARAQQLPILAALGMCTSGGAAGGPSSGAAGSMSSMQQQQQPSGGSSCQTPSLEACAAGPQPYGWGQGQLHQQQQQQQRQRQQQGVSGDEQLWPDFQWALDFLSLPGAAGEHQAAAGVPSAGTTTAAATAAAAAAVPAATTTTVPTAASSSSLSLDSQQGMGVAAAAAARTPGLQSSSQQQLRHTAHAPRHQHSGSGGAASGSHSGGQLQQQQQLQHHRPLLEPPLADDPATDVLLPPSSADQQRLEAQLSSIRDKLAVQGKLLDCHVFNTLTAKQFAALLVASWPFIPDILALCGAFEEMGW